MPTVTCPKCSKPVEYYEGMRQFRCPKCGKNISVTLDGKLM